MARKQILLFPEHNKFSEKKAGLYCDSDNRAIRSYKCIQDRDPYLPQTLTCDICLDACRISLSIYPRTTYGINWFDRTVPEKFSPKHIFILIVHLMFVDSMQTSTDKCCIFLALLLLPHSGMCFSFLFLYLNIENAKRKRQLGYVQLLVFYLR